MTQIFKIFVAFFRFLGELLAVVIKFLVFLVISPFTFYRCVVGACQRRSLKHGWFKFTWIWGAYWNKFNL